jgi:hypothetical protein
MSGPHSFGEDANCELYVTSGNVVDRIVGSQSGSVTPGCATTPPNSAVPSTQKTCKGTKRHRSRPAAAAKKRKKRCVSRSWASRL